MTEHLFQGRSWHEEYERRIQAGVDLVDGLSEQDVLSEHIGLKLDEIAAKLRLDVPEIYPDRREGRRRTERVHANDYGRDIVIDRDFIDVSIPYSGDRSGFIFSPSRSPLGLRALVHHDKLIFSCDDDDNLDRNVDQFVQRVTEALTTLRTEVSQHEPHYVSAMRSRIERRRQQITERRDRDSKRSFPIKD